MCRRISFLPMYANYSCAFKYFFEKGLELEYITPPPLTNRTLETGSKYSPDFVCTPFKTLLGSMIEALEAGANTLIMLHDSCKFGYFRELAQQILGDMGYKFDIEFINCSNTITEQEFLESVLKLNTGVSRANVVRTVNDLFKMFEYIDEITGTCHQNCGFELQKGAYLHAHSCFISSLNQANSKADILAAYERAKMIISQIPLSKPPKPLCIGMIGEFFTVMDPFSNQQIETRVANLGVEVHRWMNFSNYSLHVHNEASSAHEVKDYISYEMGPNSTKNAWCAINYAKQGFDGIIHVKPANCTPEIDLVPVLRNISFDYNIPVLFITQDCQTNDVALMTRLEAFYDMLSMKRQVKKECIMLI